MNDLETLRAMFDKANIVYEYGEIENGYWLSVEAGYVGFYSHIVFDTNKMLLSIEAYEG